MIEESIELILHAGNANTLAMQAIASAKKYDFEEAEKLLKEANAEQQLAHKCQTEILTKEAQGVEASPNILLVHAQDHVTAGSINISLANELIILYKKFSDLESKKGGEI